MIEFVKGDEGSLESDFVCELTFGPGLFIQQTAAGKCRVDLPQWSPGLLAGRGAGSILGSLESIALGTGLSMSGRVLSAVAPAQLACHVSRSASLSPGQPDVVIDWDLTRYDIGLFFDAMNPTRLTFPRDGVYRVWGSALLGYTGAGISGSLIFTLEIVKNGTDTVAREHITAVNAPNNLFDIQFSPYSEIEVLAGDYVELVAHVFTTAGTHLIVVTKNVSCSPEFGASLIIDLTPP